MFARRLSQEKVAEYLAITQPQLSKKLKGQVPVTYGEAESLKQLLGLEPEPALTPVPDHTLNVVRAVLLDLPQPDQDECYTMLKWMIGVRRDKLSLEGVEAYKKLEALV